MPQPNKTDKKAKINFNLPSYPSNADAERSVLASLMLDKMLAVELMPQLSEEDFFELRHKVIFNTMKSLDAGGNELDFVNLVEKLQRNGNLEDAGGLDYVGGLSSYIATSVGCHQHFEILKKLALMRGLLNVSKQIAEDVYSSDNADKCLENAQNRMLDVARTRIGSTLVPLGQVVNDVLHNYELVSSSENNMTGLLTGYSNLDNAMNGLQKSDLIVLAARPGVGKTAFALSIASNIARREPEKKILIFSLEMGSNQLAERMLCNVSNVDYNKVRHVALNTNDFVQFHRAMNVLAGSQIYLDQSPESNPEQIFSKCKQFSMEHDGVDLIIIDYLQLMGGDNGGDGRQFEIARISRRMKLLAKQLNVPIILLSQLNRSSEIRKDKPQLYDLRDSGSIEQDADIVWFLHKARNQPPEETYIELIIAKYRAGMVGSHAFLWNGNTMSFRPADPNVLYRLDMLDAQQKTPAAASASAQPAPAAPTVTYPVLETKENEQVAPPQDSDAPPADKFGAFWKDADGNSQGGAQ